MSTDTIATDIARSAPVEVQSGWLWTIRDSWTEAMRHLRIIPRNIELLVFSAIQPIMFVLLFVYVFGGSIAVEGFSDYEQYLLPGIMAQTVVFGSSLTSIGLAEDMHKGLVDRLRSLPMSRAAVLIGRTVSDLCRNIFTFVVMMIVAFAVGFRFEGSLAEALAATLLLLLFAYALSWVQAYIGLAVKSTEAANSAGFIWMFPMTFVSSAFVDTRDMPGWLQPIADANPFTVVTNAGRALYNGFDPGNDVLWSLLWSVGIIAVFGVICIRRFARSTAG
jgi:ABC-2 type transport system permease protein/oleandomycin transport system permease protein